MSPPTHILSWLFIKRLRNNEDLHPANGPCVKPHKCVNVVLRSALHTVKSAFSLMIALPTALLLIWRLTSTDLQVFPFPGRDETYQVPFTKVVYIEQDDFREQDQKKYFGLAPGKSVLLRCECLQAALCKLKHI